jgi:hypothetical protein
MLEKDAFAEVLFLSPFNWNGGSSNVFNVGGSTNLGNLSNNGVNGTNAVRPVISL